MTEVMILISLLRATRLDIGYTTKRRPLGHNDAFSLSECSTRVRRGSIPVHTLEIYARPISDVIQKPLQRPIFMNCPTIPKQDQIPGDRSQKHGQINLHMDG